MFTFQFLNEKIYSYTEKGNERKYFTHIPGHRLTTDLQFGNRITDEIATKTTNL